MGLCDKDEKALGGFSSSFSVKPWKVLNHYYRILEMFNFLRRKAGGGEKREINGDSLIIPVMYGNYIDASRVLL
jgi:hypothetical protein